MPKWKVAFVKERPNGPICVNCGPYEMPFIHGDARYVTDSDLTLILFLHENNDK